MSPKIKKDILIVGDLGSLKPIIDFKAKELGLTTSHVRNQREFIFKKLKFEFDIIICTIHLQFNYEGLILNFENMNYKKVIFISNDVVSEVLIKDGNVKKILSRQSKVIIPKKESAIINQIKSVYQLI